MKNISDRLHSYKEAPWSDENIIHEDENVIVYKDGYPVTEGHLLFVPKQVVRRLDITRCFEFAYEWGVKGVMDYRWEAFNVGINNGEAAGQSVMWPHVHLIPRRKGDTPNPKGGVRHVIPFKGNYDESEPAPCSRTALVRDRAIDEIKAEGRKVKKVDEKKWAEIVKRMRDKEKRKLELEKNN